LRYTARGRPHNLQRDTRRVENFGLLLALAIFDLLAIRHLHQNHPAWPPLALRRSALG
jgi:hypothetical protein